MIVDTVKVLPITVPSWYLLNLLQFIKIAKKIIRNGIKLSLNFKNQISWVEFTWRLENESRYASGNDIEGVVVPVLCGTIRVGLGVVDVSTEQLPDPCWWGPWLLNW